MRSNHQYNYNYKLDQIFSREKQLFIVNRSYDLHLKKLNEIKSKKTQSQQRVQHLEVLEKRNNLRLQRRRFDLNGMLPSAISIEQSERINKGNSQLYQKITEICNRPMQQDYYKYEDELLHHPHNLNLTFRKNQAQQIQNENIKIADRLMKQEPVLKLEEFSHSYKENKRMVMRLQRYQQCQNYMNNIRNNMTFSYRDSTNNSSIISKKKEKQQLQYQLQPIIHNLKAKSIENTEINKQIETKDHFLSQELEKLKDYQIKAQLSEIQQVNEESQIETIRQDETVEQHIQQQIEREVKLYQEEQSDDIEQQLK
ncbi:unnamed protein product (macronuclear) [Paramecium tetraurelia]|uniref:Uncharacterized protein n=1 Tax=Paramecium tetraurelia TaxID=5888 RepID=A0EE25_PARTE|nr:uncharacterized protein GSPATT00025886001 [Paramecium tetraurelia]CAK93542.1 unnamed protein product [Paramecium tetraurelia]|eukprot:XP_001460939.1 hypothetical protein (macronuclear) [Paramecium tetraurelia strain d4-2]